MKYSFIRSSARKAESPSREPSNTTHVHVHPISLDAVLELRLYENLQQLEQDCDRLENYVRKEIPQKRQEAKL